MCDDRVELNRAAFVAGSLAALGAALAKSARAASPPVTGIAPADGLARLMAGNRRFVNNDFPPLSPIAEKREMLSESQAPFAAILSCADSRVVPNIVFLQSIGDLFVARAAGNYPDDLVLGSVEYAVEHLGTRLIMVLGHQNCGAVKAVYSAIENAQPLPPHLHSIERLIAPGIESVVRARGSLNDAIKANVRAAVQAFKAAPPVLAPGVSSGHVRVVGAFYALGTGSVSLLE